MSQLSAKSQAICERHQPKGGMCMTCIHRSSDCSGLKFHDMPVVKIYPDGTRAVRCTLHQREAIR